MIKKQKADFLWYTTAFMVGTTLVLIAFYEAIKLDWTLVLLGTIPASFGITLIGMAAVFLKARILLRKMEALLEYLEAEIREKKTANKASHPIAASRGEG